MGAINRAPETFTEYTKGGTHHRYESLSKADWADAYVDLYRQVYGEDATPEAILDDAEHRDDIRRRYAGQAPARRPRKPAKAAK